MRNVIRTFMAAALLAGGLFVAGCSSSPSEEELAQLEALRQEVAALEAKVNEAKRDKAALEQQIADKNGKITQCQADQEAVKKGLGK